MIYPKASLKELGVKQNYQTKPLLVPKIIGQHKLVKTPRIVYECGARKEKKNVFIINYVKKIYNI